MTREEAIKRIKEFGLYHAIEDLPHSMYTVEAFNMAIKSLEAWDKVYVEIADIYCGSYCDNPYTAYQVRETALEIIEKHLKEVEE